MGLGHKEGANRCRGTPPPYLLGITGGSWLSLTSTSSRQVFLDEVVVSGPRLCTLGSQPSPLHGSLQVLEDDSLVVAEYLLDTTGLGPRPAQGRPKKRQQQ